MTKTFKLLLPLFLVVTFFSCNNDLDVLDDYKETTVVYSLLNFRDTTQYIRVQKAFLGEGNAYMMAQVADSIYPDSANIILTLRKFMNGSLSDSVITFTPVNNIIKKEGLFTNYPHLIFRSVDNPSTPGKEDFLDKRAIYKFTLFNKRSGQVITAETPVVADVNLDLTSPLLYASSPINLSGQNPFKTEVSMPEHGKIVNLTVIFNYTEYITGTTQFANKSHAYVLADNVAGNVNGGQKFTYEISGDKFFSWVKTKIPNNPAVYRPASLVSLDFIFTVGASEFYNYYSISNSTALLNDVIPTYTNLSDGRGLISSRVTSSFIGKRLSDASLDSLANGQYTGNLFN